jgi:uncharacterized circularly permuted ATP-grasp superfamily protein
MSPEDADHTASEEFYDEGTRTRRDGKDHDDRMREHLDELDLEELSGAVAQRARGRGLSFGSADGEMEFRIDPVPRLIDAEEWRELSAGVIQRVRALELFVADVYTDRRIVDAGVVPARAVDSACHYERSLAGMGHAIERWITVAGLDVVRGVDGSFKVLEDNLRTPSGIAYAVATREVLGAHLQPPSELRVRSLEDAFATLGSALRASAPAVGREDPLVVLLTDGEQNSAYYEHAEMAKHLGVPLVRREQLYASDGRVLLDIDGSTRAVDVIYRRTDEDRLEDDDGKPTALGELLLAPILSGTLSCVNAFGTGVADDKLLHAYVEEMIRFYLHEEPLLRSVPSYDPADPGVLEMILSRIDELVIKPRSGHGGYGVVIGPHASAEELRATAAELEQSPESFVAQETVMLSRHPTVANGRLEPRHIDLRAFAIATADGVEVPPGGLTRVAFEPGALIVNSSQNGGSKDTWVLE